MVKGEEAFTRPGIHFWFDLQFYIYKGLEGMGPDYAAAAEALVGNLLQMIDGEQVKSRLLPMSLIVRGSCGGRKA